MLFNSIDFAIFLPITFLLYWFVFNFNYKVQNAFIIACSYLFYGWWNYWFLSLIIISSFTDYYLGLLLYKSDKDKKRKQLLILSIIINLGFLIVFKYFNFFIESFSEAFSFFGRNIHTPTLKIILPVGISFYTFQTLSYSIDIYRRRIAPTSDITSFFAFVCFFPQLVAGPIERAKNLLPQFNGLRKFSYTAATDGLKQMLYGLFKKIVIADSCARYVDDIFGNYTQYSGSTLVLGAVLFAFQIYGDFSGYSDIAIGTSRLFGINLWANFKVPYFSRDIAEFWRRWHISLSTWFRDYVYIPLGGSRANRWRSIRNIFIIFIISGFWHGANWTFIAWGLFNALLFIPIFLLNKNRKYTNAIAPDRWLPTFGDSLRIVTTFMLTCMAWVLFRSENILEAARYYQAIFSKSIFNVPEKLPIRMLGILFIFVCIEWVARNRNHPLEGIRIPFGVFRWSIYVLTTILILAFFRENQSFIYFQF